MIEVTRHPLYDLCRGGLVKGPKFKSLLEDVDQFAKDLVRQILKIGTKQRIAFHNVSLERLMPLFLAQAIYSNQSRKPRVTIIPIINLN